MKRYWKKSVSLFLTVALLSMTIILPAGAVDNRSSLYLSYYRAWLTPRSGGEIAVNIDVQAVGDMDSVGALSVEMYESADGGVTWSRDGTYTSALFPELLDHDTYLYAETPIYHEGTPGYKYYAIVEVYARQGNGSDSRDYQTTTVTAKR